MPENANDTPVQTAWKKYIAGLGIVLVPQPDDRPLDQYLALRNAVLALAQSPRFLSDLQGAPKASPAVAQNEFTELLILELNTFSNAVEVSQTTETTPTESKGWRSKLWGRASTTAGSVKDLAELTPYGKGVVTLVKQVIDLFKG